MAQSCQRRSRSLCQHGGVDELAEPDREWFVDVNRSRLRAWGWGDTAAPPVFCVHGAHDHGRMFDGLAPRVADLGYQVIAYDLRGHGDSGGLDHGLMMNVSTLDVGLLAAAFDEPVGFLAHSMGAGIAFQVAAVWPERVAWIVSFDGLGPPNGTFGQQPIADEADGAMAATVKTMGRGPRAFKDHASMAVQRGSLNTRMPPEWLDHLVRHGSVDLAESGDVGWKWDPMLNTYLPTAFDVDWVEEDLRRIECPVLVLHGTEDDLWAFPSDAVADRMAHLGDVRTVPVPDAGHYLHLERPDFVFDEVRRFLAEVA